MTILGRAWVFGNNVDTDVITSGKYLFSPMEEASQHTFEAILPDFPQKVRPGDIIVAGRNFGCGSARESAPQVLKYSGIACILAEGFSRIFFRNSIAVGLPALIVEGVSRRVSPMDEISVSLDSGDVIILRTGEILKTIPLHPKMRAIIDAGGMDGLLSQLAGKIQP
jgi:3-isopropylmalate/(R)-2-methylmalate dehydratase small subunit